MTPGQASQAGQVLQIRHPIGGTRIAPHVFDLEEGGVAFIDDGWTDPLVSYHVAHIVKGTTTTGHRDRGSWSIRSEDGEVLIRIFPGNHEQEGSRQNARVTIEESLMVHLPPD